MTFAPVHLCYPSQPNRIPCHVFSSHPFLLIPFCRNTFKVFSHNSTSYYIFVSYSHGKFIEFKNQRNSRENLTQTNTLGINQYGLRLRLAQILSMRAQKRTSPQSQKNALKIFLLGPEYDSSYTPNKRQISIIWKMFMDKNDNSFKLWQCSY